MITYGYIIVDSCMISFNLNFIMQLKQFYDIANKVSCRKQCYYFWWSAWLFMFTHISDYTFSSLNVPSVIDYNPHVCFVGMDIDSIYK